MHCPTLPLPPEMENSGKIPNTATKKIKGLDEAGGRVNHCLQVYEELPPRGQGSWKNGIEARGKV